MQCFFGGKMMKKKAFIITLIGLVLISGCLTYMYLGNSHKAEYKNGVFVEGGNHYGYAKVYGLCKSL